MRSSPIVVETPGSEHAACLGEGREQGLVQQLVTEPADEALGEGILGRLSRGNVALLMPWRRQTSAVADPDSCSFRMPINCSNSTHSWRRLRVPSHRKCCLSNTTSPSARRVLRVLALVFGSIRRRGSGDVARNARGIRRPEKPRDVSGLG